MTADPVTERTVMTALRHERSLALETSVRTLPELLKAMKAAPPAVALVDVDPEPEKALALLEPVISRFNDTRFIVLGQHPKQEHLLEAMQVGARHFLAKESVAGDLIGVLNRILPATNARRQGTGCIISVLQASGGVGATILAVNLADELRLLTKSPTLLVDMDLSCGAASAFLGIEPRNALDLVLADPSRIDPELIKSSAGVHAGTLSVIECGSVTTRTHADRIALENMPRFLEAAREGYQYTVIDLPRLNLDATAEIAASSHLLLIPLQATVIGINAAKKLMTSLISHGIAGDHILPVINRFKKRGVLVRYEDVCRALGRDKVGVLENDWDAAVESMNYGKPLSQQAPRSGLRKNIAALAAEIHKSHSTNPEGLKPGALDW
jgi:pilus assembly protein CpaE